MKSIGFDKKVYLYGSGGIARELDEHGIKHIGLGPDPVPEEWNASCLAKAAEELDSDVGCVVASIGQF